MPEISLPPLPDLDRTADERTTLTEMLDHYRAVMVRKVFGLTDRQLRHSMSPSELTLGGLMLHLALVEDHWFDRQFSGNEEIEVWAEMPFDEDRDWELHHADEWTGCEILEQFEASVARSRDTVFTAASLDQLSALTHPISDQPWNLRWILVHMIEEYARHAGHADFLRQSIDGVVGD